MAEYKTMTLYIGTAELAERFKEKASVTVFGTPSAMVQAIAKGEAVVVSTPCNWKIYPDDDGYRLTDCGECVVRYGDHGAYCQHCGGVRVEVGCGE